MKIFGPNEEEIPPPPPIPEEEEAKAEPQEEEKKEVKAEEEEKKEEQKTEVKEKAVSEEKEEAEEKKERKKLLESEIEIEEKPYAEFEEATPEEKEEVIPKIIEKKKFRLAFPKIKIPKIIKNEKVSAPEKEMPQEILTIKPRGVPTEEIIEMQNQGLDKDRVVAQLRSSGYDETQINEAIFNSEVQKIEKVESVPVKVPELKEKQAEELPSFPKMEEKHEVEELKPINEEIQSEFPKPVEPIIKKRGENRREKRQLVKGLLEKVLMKKEIASPSDLLKKQEQMLKEMEKIIGKTAL